MHLQSPRVLMPHLDGTEYLRFDATRARPCSYLITEVQGPTLLRTGIRFSIQSHWAREAYSGLAASCAVGPAPIIEMRDEISRHFQDLGPSVKILNPNPNLDLNINLCS